MDDWVEALLVLAVAVLALPVFAFAVLPVGMYAMGGYGTGGHGMGYGAYGASPVRLLVAVLVPLAFLSVLASLAYRLLRSLDARGEAGGDAALAALREAYARGELTTEEYEERRARLTAGAVDDGSE